MKRLEAAEVVKSLHSPTEPLPVDAVSTEPMLEPALEPVLEPWPLPVRAALFIVLSLLSWAGLLGVGYLLLSLSQSLFQ